MIKSINPYTEEINGEFELLDFSEIKVEISKVRTAFQNWRNVSVKDRSLLVKKLADVLRNNKQKYAEIMTKEMGKPIKDSLAEVEKCAWLCDYYAENGEDFLKDELIKTEEKSFVRFDPLGILFAIMPWNFPFWQAIRAIVPAVTAGNAVILKHASNVPLNALAIEQAFIEAGFPDYVFKTLIIDSKNAMKIIDEDLIDAVTLTGSNRAGEAVGELAGKRIKKLVLELGGSDPFIVLEDADVKKAAKTAVQSRLVNAGQSCISAKRFIVMEEVAEEFTKLFLEEWKKVKIGNPMDMETDIGPIASKRFVEDLQAQLDDAESKGAKIHFASEEKQDKGFFFIPCVVPNATKDMKIMKEEVFGPIAPIISVKSHEEAIEIANDSEFGLGGTIFSKNTKKAEELAGKIESGTIVINGIMKSDPRLPFGGNKKSGLGREMSHYGLKEFVNIKTIVVGK